MLRLIPCDDEVVSTFVSQWDDELDFSAVGRVCDLNRKSVRYEYNAKNVVHSALQDLFRNTEWTGDEDYIIRPSNKKGALIAMCV